MSRVTSASSALGLLNDYALYKSTKSLGEGGKKDNASSCSIADRSQPAGGVSHKPGGRLPLLSARPAVTHAALKRAATSFAAR